MTDKEIQQAVLHELEWEPQVKSTEIGVAVKDGIVTLTGFVDSYIKKFHAERAAQRVTGVKVVVNDLEVKLPISSERTDEDIARAVVQALASHISVPQERIKVTVHNDWITLEGDVDRLASATHPPLTRQLIYFDKWRARPYHIGTQWFYSPVLLSKDWRILMRQPINTQPIYPHKEFEKRKESLQRILPNENSKHWDRRPRGCGQDQLDRAHPL